MSKPWTDSEDQSLVRWGRALVDGYAFIAAHDLGRSEQEGRDRIKHLRATRPEWVAAIEAEERAYDAAA